jgi:predicted TIM-barrel fold metal-dependent hydrolase
VDIHTHVDLDATERALAIMDRRGIERVVNASGGYGERADESARLADETGGRILFFCNIDFSEWGNERFAEHAVDELERCRRLGGVGLKIFKGLGLKLRGRDGKLVAVDDPALDPIFEKAGELGMVVLIHSGDPKAFFEPADEDNERWEELEAHPKWSFHGDGYPPWEEVYAQFERRVARHPETTFLGAHFGNNPEDPERVFEMMKKHPNLRIDTAARIPEIGRFDAARMRELFGRFADRIHFGTDIGIGIETLMLGSGPPFRPGPKAIDRFFSATWRYFETRDRQFDHPTPIQGDWKIDGIGLSCEQLEKVYHSNTEKLIGISSLASGGGGS